MADYADRDLIYEHSTDSIQNFNKTDLLALQEALDTTIKERGLEKVLKKQPLNPICYSSWPMQFLGPYKNDRIYGIPLNESILANCVEGSYLPTNLNETILLTSSELDVNIGDWFNITFFHYSDVTTNVSHSIQITGVITPETLNKTSPLRSTFSKYLHLKSENHALLTDFAYFLELFNILETNFRSLIPTFRFYVDIWFRFDIQVESINQKNVIQLISSLVSFLKESQKGFHLNNANLKMIWFEQTSGIIVHKVEEYNTLFLSFLLLCSPVLLLTILLVLFSLGLINKQRQRSLGLFKMRGVSPKFLLFFLLAEIVVLALIAVPISIILGILEYLLISTTTGFISFNLASIPTTLVFPPLFLPLIIIFSICLTLLPYILPMRRLIKSDLPLLEQESPITEKSTLHKLVSKIDLDIFLLLQGLFGLVILIFLLQIINTNNLDIEEAQILNLFLPLIQLLLVVSPFSFLVGFIFTYNRFVPLIIQKFGNYSWKKDWGLLATAFRSLSIKIKTTGNVTVLLICTLSFLMILSSFPLAYYQYQIEYRYYVNGADIVLGFPEETTSLNNTQTQLNSIEGCTFTTISKIGFIIPDIYESNQEIYFFGIEENFNQIAYWRDYYDDQSLFDLVQSLFNSSDPYPIVLDSITAQGEGLSMFDLYHPFLGETDEMIFSVTGVTDYWPRFVDKRRSTYHYIITKKSLIENISNTAQNYYNIRGYVTSGDKILCKVLPGYDPDTVTNQILNLITNDEFDGSITTVRSQLESESQKQRDQFFWIITNFNFYVSLIVVLVVIILFLLMRVSIQTTELGLSRALGMKNKQVFLLLFTEPLILFFISGIPGVLIGLLFMMFIASVFSPLLVDAPPFILNFNIPVLFFIYSFIFVVTILTGVLTSLMATRANISETLKVE
jgi:ABC-type antimicrobial peptide transport system permease subunit